MENRRSCEDFLNMQSHQAISDNKIVNSAIPCCVLIFWHWCAHYLSMHLSWCQPAPFHRGEEGVLRHHVAHRQVQGSRKPCHSRRVRKVRCHSRLINGERKLGESWREK